MKVYAVVYKTSDAEEFPDACDVFANRADADGHAEQINHEWADFYEEPFAQVFECEVM